VVRVNFTADDLARTRFSAFPAPLVETGLAVAELRRPSAKRARPWLLNARLAFPATGRLLLELANPCGAWPLFTEAHAPDLDEALDFVRSTPRWYLRDELAALFHDRPGRPATWVQNLATGDGDVLEAVVRAMRDVHDAIVAPRWDSVVSSFHGDVARRMPVLAAAGHEVLFDTIDDRLWWRADGLERAGNDIEVELGGTGLLLMPSAFWSGPPMFGYGDGVRQRHSLVYAARPNGQRSDPDRAGIDHLAALLGPTRAAVLRALAEPHGTTQLAYKVGISSASASEHAKVLRDANLIETHRQGRSVRHSLTPLGRTMVGQLRADLTG
jgi:DNA-binding transcriptional ArsR family regulator